MSTLGWCLAALLLVGFDERDEGAPKPDAKAQARQKAANQQRAARAKPAKKAKEDKPARDEDGDDIDDGNNGAQSFVGVIVENGRTRRFTNQGEFDKALERNRQGDLRAAGAARRRSNPSAFRGVINDNGKVVEFKDPKAWFQAQQRMQREMFGRMRRGMGAGRFEAFGDEADNMSGFVVQLKHGDESARLFRRIQQLADGGDPNARLSSEVKLALAKTEIDIEFLSAADVDRLVAACLDLLADKQNAQRKIESTATALVGEVGDEKGCSALGAALAATLTRAKPVAGKPAGSARAVVSEHKIVLQFDGDAVLARARKALQANAVKDD